MNRSRSAERGFVTRCVLYIVVLGVLGAALAVAGPRIWQSVQERLMQRVESPHYEIRSPADALPKESLAAFAAQRESLFSDLNSKLRGAASQARIRIIFDPEFSMTKTSLAAAQNYTISGTTIRTRLTGKTPQLDPAADAQVLLSVAWGKPASPEIAEWTALALVGKRRDEDIGMTAAGVEQKLGHQKVSSLLDARSTQIPSSEDRAVLGGAWVSGIVEFGGPAAARKLYSAKISILDENSVARTLGTKPEELERTWQLFMYSYLAGMPSSSQPMPANMPMN